MSARSENEHARIVIPKPTARRSEGWLGGMTLRKGSMGAILHKMRKKTDSSGRLVVLELAGSVRVMEKAKLLMQERSGVPN